MLILLLISCMSVAHAEDILECRRVYPTLPHITAELSGNSYSADLLSASLDNSALAVEDVHAYDKTRDSSCVYIIVDLSTSMKNKIDLVKTNVNILIDSLSDNDKIVLLTIGENDVFIPLGSDATKQEIKDAVNSFTCDQHGTVFYEAINKACSLSDSTLSSFTREYAVVFSDGVDYQQGNRTFDEIYDICSKHTLPIYAACADNTSKQASDLFGRLARASGGAFKIIRNSDEFEQFVTDINNVTIVQLSAQGDYSPSSNANLMIKYGDSQVNCEVSTLKVEQDNDPPTITDVEYVPDKNYFTLKFSEDVVSSDNIDSYTVYCNNKSLTVKKVEKTDSKTVCVTLEEKIKKGTYTFAPTSIYDLSIEKNQITGEAVCIVENVSSDFTPVIIGILIVVLILAVASVVLIIVFRRKKETSDSQDIQNSKHIVHEYDGNSEEVIKHHIKSDSSIELCMKVVSGKSDQTIKTNINSSIIVGRSNICDVFIDDAKMSRQHFVIENSNGALFITDLQSSNGTKINNIKISNKHKLNVNDKISAGLTDIIILSIK